MNPKSIARLQTAIWILIYGGLFAAILGYALQRGGDAWGWGLVGGGLLGVAVGIVLIVVRSRLPDTPQPGAMPIASLEEP